ncbi:hypothetical protein CSW98_08145 [Vibrio sp. HA2012]|uniref:hypothetical protein n=1 Tax=Vibrio sp. HA2012 TaxID=1971595 RepID=UPI000C2CD868|nr:hypothetical protein [Vibrio sp. HA2012]PJC86948.1 hypothetical protein CSW98_08145 [Vibrio sp. HA2012]
MSINSLNHEEMSDRASTWDPKEEESRLSPRQVKSAQARRRIEMMKDLRESGLTMEEAEEMGLLD